MKQPVALITNNHQLIMFERSEITARFNDLVGLFIQLTIEVINSLQFALWLEPKFRTAFDLSEEIWRGKWVSMRFFFASDIVLLTWLMRPVTSFFDAFGMQRVLTSSRKCFFNVNVDPVIMPMPRFSANSRSFSGLQNVVQLLFEFFLLFLFQILLHDRNACWYVHLAHFHGFVDVGECFSWDWAMLCLPILSCVSTDVLAVIECDKHFFRVGIKWNFHSIDVFLFHNMTNE